jgi:hypothetical protein
LDIAKNFDPEIQKYRKNLEVERDEALKRFKLAYEVHLDFIKEKKITLENPFEMVQITPLRKENIKELAISAICKEHGDDWFRNCPDKKPEEGIELFKKSFPKILDLTTSFLSECVKEQIEDAEEAISSYRQLLSCRTLLFSSSSVGYRDLREKVASELQMLRLGEKRIERYFASLIMKCIFEELTKGREIAYYNPDVGYGGYATHCIFC